MEASTLTGVLGARICPSRSSAIDSSIVFENTVRRELGWFQGDRQLSTRLDAILNSTVAPFTVSPASRLTPGKSMAYGSAFLLGKPLQAQCFPGFDRIVNEEAHRLIHRFGGLVWDRAQRIRPLVRESNDFSKMIVAALQ